MTQEEMINLYDMYVNSGLQNKYSFFVWVQMHREAEVSVRMERQ